VLIYELRKLSWSKCSNPRTSCAGQFLSRSFVVLLRKSNPQNYNLQIAVVRGVIGTRIMNKIFYVCISILLCSCAYIPEKLYEGKKSLSEISVIEGYSVPLAGKSSSIYYVHFSSIATIQENQLVNQKSISGKVLHVEPGRYLVTTYCFYNNGISDIYAQPSIDLTVEAGKKYVIECQNTESQETLGQRVPVQAVVGSVTINTESKSKSKEKAKL
jgi:hypothetical protein